MKIELITKDNYCKNVVVTYTPAEWMIAKSALKQFIKNENNHPMDIYKAKCMDKTDEGRNNEHEL